MIKFLTYSNSFIDWSCKILLSINIIIPGINFADETNYPLDVLVLAVIALWLYFYNVKIISIPILLMALFINYLHTGVQS